jgi:serine/threonine protein kinase
MALTIGSRIGPYEILGALGAGGMGLLYRGNDTRLNRPVAITVLPAAGAGDPERRQRFEREGQAIAALNHSHICAVYDVAAQDGALCLVIGRSRPRRPSAITSRCHSRTSIVAGRVVSRSHSNAR